MKKQLFSMLFLFISLPAFSAYEYEGPGIIIDKNEVVGLITLEAAFTTGPGVCTQVAGLITIEGLQFSKSGKTLESFYFVDSEGYNVSVPTGFDRIKNLSNHEMGIMNNFIKKGNEYIARIQFCGNGGYPALIDIYNKESINRKL